MWPYWAAFAVHSLEIARSAAAPKPLSCGTRTKVRLLVLFIRTLEASCRGLGMQWRTPQVRRWNSASELFQPGWWTKAGLRFPATVEQTQEFRRDLYRWPTRIEALLYLC